MNTAIVCLVSIYLAGMLILGLRAQSVGRSTAEDYFLADRSVSWFHLGLTFFATWFSTLAFLGVAGFHYTKGVNWYFAQGTFWLLAPIAAWIFGRRIWALGKVRSYLTPGDLLADSYNSAFVRFLTGMICVFALIPYTLVQLVGIGKVFEASTSGVISYSLGVCLTAIATAFYTVIGGVRAIIWTDIVQGLLFLGVTLIAVFVAAGAAGGLHAGFAAAQAAHPELFVIDLNNIGKPLTTILIWTPGFVLLPHLWQRNYMAKSEEAFTKSIVVFSLLSLVLLLATMLIGVSGMSIVSSLSDSDKLIPAIFGSYAPLLLPLLVLATFAAGMSTVDSQLLTSSSVITGDVLRALGIRIHPDNERILGRIIVVVLIAALTFLALLPESQGAIFTLASKGTAIAFLLLLPLLIALRGEHCSSVTGISVLLSGIAALAALELGLVKVSLPFGFGTPISAFLVQLAVYQSTKLLNIRSQRSVNSQAFRREAEPQGIAAS
ncbi:MAG: sodium:solute symporter family protein [Bdellovibrionales bacterium]|nr:sodium:solute symporter family protein [Bdellovibrionales bacterium]